MYGSTSGVYSKFLLCQLGHQSKDMYEVSISQTRATKKETTSWHTHDWPGFRSTKQTPRCKAAGLLANMILSVKRCWCEEASESHPFCVWNPNA